VGDHFASGVSHKNIRYPAQAGIFCDGCPKPEHILAGEVARGCIAEIRGHDNGGLIHLTPQDSSHELIHHDDKNNHKNQRNDLPSGAYTLPRENQSA
jgi:hypothetical protein